jgi:hypothetical protein
MSIDIQSCCEFHGVDCSLTQGRSCPARNRDHVAEVQHLRYTPTQPSPVSLPKWAVEAMDETLTFEIGA